MTLNLSKATETFLKSAIVLLAFNELRGIVLAMPILYAMYEAGGTWMAIWLGFCSLAGIALSVFAPIVALKFISRHRFAAQYAEPITRS